MSLSLNKIFAHAGRDLLIRELTIDSRNVRAGDLFLAVPGGRFDGRAHIGDALARGAVACLVEHEGAEAFVLTGLPVAALQTYPLAALKDEVKRAVEAEIGFRQKTLSGELPGV